MSSGTGVLECVSCKQRFDVDDMGRAFILEELHCVPCYAKRLVKDEDCFGGWEPTDVGCSTFCLDRRTCKMFSLGVGVIPKFISPEVKRQLLRTLGEIKLYRSQRFNPLHPFAPGSIRRAVFDMAVAGTTRDELKAFLNRIGSSYPVQMKVIKRGFGNGHLWDYHETLEGKIWIEFTPCPVLQRDKKVRRKN